MITAYLAGAIRDKHDYLWRDTLAAQYRGQLKCFVPADIGNASHDWDKLRKFGGQAYMTYRTDLALIDAADVVIVNLLPMDEGYPSIGTLVELGYARAKNKLILIVASANTKSHPFVAFAGDGVFDSFENLDGYLGEYLSVRDGHKQMEMFVDQNGHRTYADGTPTTSVFPPMPSVSISTPLFNSLGLGETWR